MMYGNLFNIMGLGMVAYNYMSKGARQADSLRAPLSEGPQGVALTITPTNKTRERANGRAH